MNAKIVAALTAALAILSAVVLTQANADEVRKGQAVYLGTAEELCRSNGVMWFEDRDEWPVTRDGRQAIDVVRERCAKNPKAFASPDSIALR